MVASIVENESGGEVVVEGDFISVAAVNILCDQVATWCGE